MLAIEDFAQHVYDRILNVYQHGFEMKDEQKKPTRDPSQARTFEFPFIKGNDYTAISVNITDGSENKTDKKQLQILYYEDIDKYMTPEQKRQWFDWKEGMKKLAVSHVYNYKDQNISRPPFTKNNDDGQPVLESLSGTSRSSYQIIGPVKIIARHTKKINPDQKGARARNIAELFVQTQEGERFKLPEGTSLNGARAYARHIKNGGSRDDDFGQHITKIVSEMNDLKFFVRNMRGRIFEDEETNKMVQAAIDHYGDLHRTLFMLRGQRGYEKYRDLWQPEEVEEDTLDINELKEKFVRKVFDDRLTVALPIVDRAYKKFKNKELQEFESWTEDMTQDVYEEDQNPIEKQNIQMRDAGLDIEESESVFDDENLEPTIESLLNDNQFNWSFEDGVIYLDSNEELERAKDIFAAFDPEMPMPELGVKDYTDQTYGSSTNDREIVDNRPMEESVIFDFKRLAGIAK